ncbi:hypothetical protein GCM10008090_03640 [Arenicella chitinivorans]|uniref:Lipoprotein n=1 Tax=Arenicella chitinivorans TaxID=1329800 RepID=A0A918VIA1_9GAMM|nr:hypothetical protein [Arenicella chitinivorans]GGZ98441.1 hypothetical protein GCM10008090_03640 [Arenicella chitinivorans]
MKNLALTLAMAVLLAACSSGSTVSPLPSTVNSQFSGTFKNQNNTQNGEIRFDIAEDEGGNIVGNMIVTNNTNIRCIANGTLAGSSNGFNISLITTQTRSRFLVITEREQIVGTDDNGEPIIETTSSEVYRDSGSEGVRDSIDSRGLRTTISTTREDVTGDINIQLAISNNGNTISGTYVADASLCSNSTGTGDMTLNRI